MVSNLLKWLRKVIPNSYNFFSFSRANSDIKSLALTIASVNKKIYGKTNLEKESVSLDFYEEYFENLKSLGLWRDFEIITSEDQILLKGCVLTSPIVNQNSSKVIIFCHGITCSKLSLFYCIHLVMQLGYQVVLYDARNHGLSGKSYNTLGKVESLDLEDVVEWTIKGLKPEEIGLYGFSMGSATLLFWIGQFQSKHSEVTFAICDSPFDNFKKRFLQFLDVNSNSKRHWFDDWKTYFFYGVVMKMLKSPVDISEINPILALPKKLKMRLLLLHGLSDTVISWDSSMQIWEKLNKNPANKNMLYFYLFENADHGELPFLGDYLPNSVTQVRGKKKKAQLSFSLVIHNFLTKDL